MKKHMSIFMLMARTTIYKVIALFLAMAVVEGTLFYLALDRALDIPLIDASSDLTGQQAMYGQQAQQAIGLESLFTKSLSVWVFAIAFVLLTALLCLTGCEYGSKQGYTLRRLTISGPSVFIWQAVYNSICFFLLWAVQLTIILALSKLYLSKMTVEAISGQTVFLAFYRNSFLHSILPLDEISLYVRNIVLIIGLGTSSAGFSFKQRRGKLGVDIILLVPTCLVFFTRRMGNFGNDAFLIFIAVIIAVESIYQAYKRGGLQ